MYRFFVARLIQLLSSELAYDLQHVPAPVNLQQETLVGEGREAAFRLVRFRYFAVIVSTYRARRQVEAAGEDGQLAEGGLFTRGEEAVAPGERMSQGLLARREVVRAIHQHAQWGS